jgi:alginate O-acetyltransferase complex protein AlgJ
MLNWLGVGIFIVTLFVPLLNYLTPLKSQLSTSENRSLTQWPSNALAFSNFRQFIQEIGSYFDDHLLLRDELITLHNAVKYLLLGTSPNERVILGDENWLFLSEEVHQQKPLREKHIEEIRKALSNRASWYHKKNITYLFVAVPDKATLYSEHLPSKHQKTSFSRPHQLVSELPVTLSNIILTLEPSLKLAKTTNRLYYLSDSHWNYAGSHIGYTQILKKLQKKHPQLQPYGHSFFNLVQSNGNNLDLAKMLQLGDWITESSFFPPKDYSFCTDRKIPLGDYAPTDPHGRRPFALECPSQKLRGIIFGDSFSLHLLPYLKEHFGRLTFVFGRPSFEAMTRVVQHEAPDIVIEERVGRYLHRPWE